MGVGVVVLRLLGGATARNAEGTAVGVAAHRHVIALLALLAGAPSEESGRSKLVGLLWPDSTERAARNRLNTYVHRIRDQLGRDVLLSVGDRLRLNRDVVDCDVWRFEEALEAKRYARAVELYDGPLLDGFVLSGSPAFEQWADRESERLARAYRAALSTLAEEAEGRGEFNVASSWWQELAWEDPYDSRIAIRLMHALRAAGNPAAAVRAGRAHVAHLGEELGVEPTADLRELIVALETTPADPSTVAGPGPRGPDLDERAVAILPFESLGGGEAALFADGLHNDLLTRLSRVRGITVISRSSVLRYRPGSASIPDIGRELGAATVVEASVQRLGDRLRLNVQLIDARRDAHRWAQTFERTLTVTNMFDIQGELAGMITESLRARLTEREREQAMEWTPTTNLEAYRMHAMGRARLDERTERGMRRAATSFRQALELDSEYALAWVGLADALTLLADYGFEGAPNVLPEAEQAAVRALDLDPDLAEAHASLGLVASVRRDGPESIRRLARAVELRPAYAEACNWSSWVSSLLGRPQDALAWAQRAVELDPLSAESTVNLAIGCMTTGDLRRALREARRVSELQPDWTSGPFIEAHVLYRMGRLDAAEQVLEGLTVAWTGVGAEATLALIHAATGRRDRTAMMLAEFEAKDEAFAAGLLHLALGNVEAASGWLDQADVGRHWPTMAVRFLHPEVWETLQDERRHDALLERVNRGWGLAPDGSLPTD